MIPERITACLLVLGVAFLASTGAAAAAGCDDTANFTYTPDIPETDRFAEYTAKTDYSNATYSWSFDDGATYNRRVVNHEFQTLGKHNVTLNVTVGEGANASTASCTRLVKVQSQSSNVAPTAAITVSPRTLLVRQPVTLDASASDDIDGYVERYEWFVGGTMVASGGSEARVITQSFDNARSYRVALRVYDDDNYDDFIRKNVRVIPERPTELSVNVSANRSSARVSLAYLKAGQPVVVDAGVGDGVVLESLNFTPSVWGNYSFTVAEDDVGPVFNMSDAELLTYFNVSGSTPGVGNASFTFSVDSARVGNPEGVSLYRYDDGWRRLNTSYGGLENGRYGYTAVSGSLSVFAVATTDLQPRLEVTGVDVSRRDVVEGDSVSVTTDVSNTGRVNGSLQLDLVVGGEVVATGQTDVEAGGTDSVDFTYVFTRPGTYNVSVNGVGGGTVSVEAAPSGDGPGDGDADGDGTGNGSGDESGDAEGLPGFGALVAIAALVAAYMVRGR